MNDDRDIAERVASIVGPDSAALRGLKELHRREASGEDVRIWRVAGKWIVGPAVSVSPTIEGEG